MNTLLLLPILWPLCNALLVAVPRTRTVGIALAFAAPLTGTLVLFVCERFTSLWLPSVLFGTLLRLDDAAWVFLLLSSSVWFLAGLFALKSSYSWGFWFFWLLSMSGNLGLCLAADGVSFYLFFALMSFSAYPLIIAKHTPEALRAGKVYLVMALLGEVALLSGMLLAFDAVGDHAFDSLFMRHLPSLSLVLLLVGFGVKVGVFGLHVWLPLAHSIAPAPASAVLSGVMLKAGLLGWIRFLPLGQEAHLWLGFGLAGLGLCGMFGGVLVGLAQKELKPILAYSSVSQMGLIAAVMGIGLATPHAREPLQDAVVLYALHHAFVKAGLFFVAGIALHHYVGKVNLTLGILLGLSLCGAPLSSGAVAKGAIKSALEGVWLSDIFGWVLFLGAVFSTALVVHFFAVLWRLEHEKTAEENAVIGACVVASMLVAGYGFSGLHLENVAPLGLGALLFYGRERMHYPTIPKGDVLHLLPRLSFHPHWRTTLSTPLRLNLDGFKEKALGFEVWFSQWNNSATVWLGLACGAIGVLLFF